MSDDIMSGGLDDSQATIHDHGGLDGTTQPDGASLRIGSAIGRYVVLARLGAGAMGQVVMAYDPQLDRRVAIKLLKPEVKADGVWLRREAQALGKLTHPNVVSVFDVGEHDGSVFVAMEFVEGETLRKWCAGDPAPSWPEVLDVFEQAGRGLSAAHASGLVHRDFKPENVMRGRDGRIRVMDFGLARADRLLSEGGVDGSMDEGATASLVDMHLTRTGALAGTPAYMAPEQYRGQADARSDQFSFCVALFEALYGRRPHDGGHMRALYRAAMAGPPEPSPRSRVPAFVHEVVRRGLMPDPEARFPSMDALLAALRNDPRVMRRRWLSVAGVALVVGAAATVVGLRANARPPLCEEFEDDLVGIWDPQIRDDMGSAFGQSKLAYAGETWELVRRDLDAYAKGLVDHRRSACLDNAEGRESDSAYDRRIVCLEQREAGLRATVDALSKVDDALMPRAARLSASLPALAECDDAELLEEESPLPVDPARRDRVMNAFKWIERTRVARAAGDLAGAEAELLALEEESRSIDFPWLTAAVMVERAQHEFSMGRQDDSEAQLEEIYRYSLRHDLRVYALQGALLSMGRTVSKDQVPRGRRWMIHAEPLVQGLDVPAQTAGYLEYAARVELADGNVEAAIEGFEGALAVIRESDDPRMRMLESYALGNLANIHYRRFGDDDKALSYALASLESAEKGLGTRHPNNASALQRIANIYGRMGDHERAQEYRFRNRELMAETLGAEDPRLDTFDLMIGVTYLDMGELEKARPKIATALERLSEKAPNDPHVMIGTNAMAEIDRMEGKFDAARAGYLRALELMGDDIPSNASIGRSNLALLELEAGEYDKAIEIFEKCLHEFDVLLPKVRIGQYGETRFGLARAMIGAGRDPAEARKVAEQARAEYEKGNEPEQVAKIDAWLAEL